VCVLHLDLNKRVHDVRCVGHYDSRSTVQRWRCRGNGLHGNQ